MRLAILTAVLILGSSSATGEVAWPRYLDVDLAFRPSALRAADRPWDIRIGAGIELEPGYQGSDRTQTEIDPLFLAAYRTDWGSVFLRGDGLGYSRMLSDRFGMVLQLEAEDTRDADDDNRLAGLGDQHEELEIEIVGRYYIGSWSAGASIAPATGDKGLVWFVGGAYTWTSSNHRWFATLGADLSGSSRANQQTDFGVTVEQSAASGFPVYSPNGGLKSAALNLAVEYQLAARWYLNLDVDFERLLGDVADSPIVFDTNNMEAGIGMLYRF